MVQARLDTRAAAAEPRPVSVSWVHSEEEMEEASIPNQDPDHQRSRLQSHKVTGLLGERLGGYAVRD